MIRLKYAARAALLLAIAACTGDATAPAVPAEPGDSGPAPTISDAAHSGAVPGFYFLPPMVSAPAYSGTFDAGLHPRVEICPLAGTTCAAPLAQYTMAAGTGGELVKLASGAYQVNWHTNQFALDPTATYRISVFAGTFRLGFADVDVVSSGKELKNVDTQEFIALVDGRTLPIKFRIETGIAGQVIVAPDSASIPVGATQQFTATVLDLHGDALAAPVTWTSSSAAVATVDDSGLATAAGTGQAIITATAQAASGDAVLTVFNPNTPPVAVADTFQAIGNVTVPVAAPGVLANDTDGEGNPLAVVAGTYPTAAGGSVTLTADGGFSYASAAGFTGTDGFEYTVTDGTDSVTASVTVVSAYRVWYVDNAAAAPGDGRDASPFAALKAAEAAAAAGETIFLRTGDGTSAGYDEGIVLKTGQSLTGQGVAANVTASLNGQTIVLLAAGSAPVVTRAAGTTVQVATNNVLQGFDVASAAGAGIGGTGFGALTVAAMSVSANGGPALDLSSGDVAGSFASLSSTGSTSAGLRLTGIGGSVSADGGTITVVGGATAGIEVMGGAGAFTYGGDVVATGPLAVSVSGRTGGALAFGGTIAATGNGIAVRDNGGGSVAFTGASKTLSTGANPGVRLENNAGASISFGGGGLVVATTTGNGFDASGGGTVTVTGAGNSVVSAGGTAVRVANTTIGAAGISFYSVSAAGGVHGIELTNTGGGGFQVTGDGASDPSNATRGRITEGSSGGSITPGSGGTVSGTTGAGVSLSGAASVVLRNLVVQGNAGDGVAATDVSGLVLDNTLVTGHAGQHGVHGKNVSGLRIVHSDLGHNATTAGLVESADIWNVRLDNLSGAAAVAHSLLHHSQETVVGVVNTTGALDLSISNSSITDTGTGAGGANGLQLTAEGTSSMTVTLQNATIARARARGVTASTALASGASLDLSVTGSDFADNATVGLELVHGSGGAASFNFAGNDFQRHGSVPVNVNRLGSPGLSAFGVLTGTISGNTVGTAGVAGSGTTGSANGIAVESNGTGGVTRVAIVNNVVRRVGQYGIFVGAVDASSPGTTLEARVEGNSVLDLSPGALDGINVLPGALGTDVPTVCLNVRNNESTGVRNGLRVRTSGLPAAAPTIRLAGWDGATPVNTYFTAQNTLAGGLGPVSSTAGSGAFTAVASCNTP